MKKHLIISLLICLIFSIFIGFASPLLAGEELSSSSAILIDAETGQILYGKSPYTLYSSGDFDKLLNVITALKAKKTTNSLTVSQNALDVYTSSPNLGLTDGETVKLLDMLYAEYLEGHNDAANVVAENIGRLYLDTTGADYTAMTDAEKAQAAIDAYVGLMNDTADELCASTLKATNADGHYYDTQKCSCLDVAKLIKNGLKTNSFKKLFTTEEYTFTLAANTTDDNSDTTSSTSDTDTSAAGEITLNSSNPLFNGNILYAGVKGGCIAYNSESDKYHCAVYAVKGDLKLIAVVMNGTQSGVYDDIQALLNLGFYKWKSASITESTLSSMLPDDISSLNLAFTGNMDFLLPSGYNVDDLEAAVAYTENGYLSGTITLTLPEDATYAGTVTTISFYEKNEPSVWGPVLIIALIIMLVLVILILAFLTIRFFGAKNKAYTRRIRFTARKEKEKYLKRIKDQTSTLYNETNKLKPHNKPYEKETRLKSDKNQGKTNAQQRSNPQRQNRSQPPIRHKDTK